jgi:hypothetical protein
MEADPGHGPLTTRGAESNSYASILPDQPKPDNHGRDRPMRALGLRHQQGRSARRPAAHTSIESNVPKDQEGGAQTVA